MDKSTEEKWRKLWEEERIFEIDATPGKRKVFVTVPFPYMNGPLHIGHAFTYCRADVYARFKRMQGFSTLFPFAWHWTGQPLVAAAQRLANGDASMIREFVEIDGIPKEQLSKFYDPEYMAKYYTESGRAALKRLGLSIDWRREFHTTDLEPTFSKFVLWQMEKLRQKGFITRGTHPVVWCPRDQSPTGDHDRLEGEGVTWEEFTLVLFSFEAGSSFNGARLPAATLRPETIFGVTNLWVNPTAKYVLAEVDGKENWILSERAALKLSDQLKKVTVLRSLSGRELIGQRVIHPLEPKRTLLILPGEFVDPDNGSGIVYSVPAHAPMDYVALFELQRDPNVPAEFNVSNEEIQKIVPIPVISIPGMGEFPAVEVVEKMGIRNQNDPRVENATNEVYKKEFHQGILNQNALEFRSRKVSEAKPLIIEFLKGKGLADQIYDLPEKVVCRCMTECTVKILEDQWFLKYSDLEWKKKAHECIDMARIYPDSVAQWFHDLVNWIKDWPCARKVGLGTPLPWSPGWIVETLSDSTIYMCFYTISAAIKKHSVPPEALTNALFDYVFLGEGEVRKLSAENSVRAEAIEEMRSEFLYWYSVDLRNSAKELVPNHLLFFVFQHVAFFPKELWPKGISVNGMMMNEGMKMGKSKGNVITLSHALDEYDADSIRASLLSSAEGMEDADWRVKNVKEFQAKLNSLPNFISLLFQNANPEKSYGEPELLLESRIQRRVSSVVQCLENMKTKSAFQEAFYDFWNDLRYYLRRTETHSRKLLEYAVSTWTELLMPFIPFTCEEISSTQARKGLVAISGYPSPDSSKFHPEAELEEISIERLIQDTQNITKLMKERPSTLHLYLPAEWSYSLLAQAIERGNRGKTGDILQAFFASNPEVAKKDAAAMLPRVIRMLNELGDDFVKGYREISGLFDEGKTYSRASAYLKQELGMNIVVHKAADRDGFDPKQKARFALPLKPALYLE